VISGHSLYTTIAMIMTLVSLGPCRCSRRSCCCRCGWPSWMVAQVRALGGSRRAARLAGPRRDDAPLHEDGRWWQHLERPPGRPHLEPFVQQANEYAVNEKLTNLIWKILNTLNLTHPMNVVRAAEVQRGCRRRLRPDHPGEYVRRGTEEHDRPFRDDLREAAKHYGDEFKSAAEDIKNAAKRAAGRAKDATTRPRRSRSVRILIVGVVAVKHAIALAVAADDPPT